jgi:hypothetical protein
MRDIDIRRELLREMRRRHDGELDTLIMPELGLCQGMARVDLAVVNGTVHGYEIKSEQDTLARLPSQAEVYSRTLEFVTIIASASHSQKIRDLIPSWWGIWIAIEDENGMSLKPDRDAHPNPKIDPFSLAQLLWREEAFQVLNDRGLTGGMRSKPRSELWRKLASELTIEDLAKVVRGCLKRRGAAWRVPVLQA